MSEASGSSRGGTPTGRMVIISVVGLLVTAVTLWLALRGVKLDEVGDALRAADTGLLVVGAVALMAPFAANAARWKVIVGPQVDLGIGRYGAAVILGAACNNALPGRVGEVARAVALARMAGTSNTRVFGTVIVDRLCDAVFASLALAATSMLAGGARWVKFVALAGCVASLAALVAIAWAARYARRRQTPPTGKVTVRVWEFARGVSTVGSVRDLARIAAWTATGWGIWSFGAWAVARSVGVDINGAEALFICGATMLGAALPSSPGFVGTYHWVASESLQLFGASQATGVAFAVLLHALWFVPSTIIGGAVMLRMGLRFRDIQGRRDHEEPASTAGVAT